MNMKAYNYAPDCRVGLSKPKINVNILLYDRKFFELACFALRVSHQPIMSLVLSDALTSFLGMKFFLHLQLLSNIYIYFCCPLVTCHVFKSLQPMQVSHCTKQKSSPFFPPKDQNFIKTVSMIQLLCVVVHVLFFSCTSLWRLKKKILAKIKAIICKSSKHSDVIQTHNLCAARADVLPWPSSQPG